MKYEKRPSSQDLLNQSEPLLGHKSTFEEAYPEIDTIEIEYIEDQIGGFSKPSDGDMGHRILKDKRYIGEYLPCSNTYCYDGGVNIGFIIHEMVRTRKTESKNSSTCRGHEGSPKGKKIYRRCMHRFKYTIKIRYKELTE